MEALEKLNQFLNKWLLVIGGIAVLALMALATGNVIMRIFGVPFRGAYELVSFLGAVVTAFALGYTQKRKFNIVVDGVGRIEEGLHRREFRPGLRRREGGLQNLERGAEKATAARETRRPGGQLEDRHHGRRGHRLLPDQPEPLLLRGERSC